MPFGVGYVLGHGGFAAAVFAAVGISTLLLSLQAGEGPVMQGMSASFVISSAPAYLGGRARVARRLRLR
jgi:UDP-3-O-acyl-N-acetylglucosamine deacetylase